jgi:hypothetical protein
MIDDATNTRLSRFFEEETIAGVMEVFSLWIRSYGIPEALYPVETANCAVSVIAITGVSPAAGAVTPAIAARLMTVGAV